MANRKRLQGVIWVAVTERGELEVVPFGTTPSRIRTLHAEAKKLEEIMGWTRRRFRFWRV